MMKKILSILALLCIVFAAKTLSEEAPPLKLVESYRLPADVKGNFDHFAIDLAGKRLFATPEAYKAVLVIDLKSGQLIHKIQGIEKPHAILFREDLKRLYVTDGESGDLKIVDSESYAIVSSVKLLEDADSIGYDNATKYLYIDNGGGDVHQTYSMLSIVDTSAGKKVADIKVDGDTLEAMVLDRSTPRIFLNNKAKSQVDVLDREKRSLIVSWPVTLAKTNVAMAYDEANHRLFVACRSGSIVVLDTQSGKEITALPITKGVDDLVFDPIKKRLYASCDGNVDIYKQRSPDDYQSLGKVSTGALARTALLVPQLNRYFVAVPQHGTAGAEIQVFEVR
jgi:DNA-binding beta-propeller fold protein YncE